jgi:hypothetical protein
MVNKGLFKVLYKICKQNNIFFSLEKDNKGKAIGKTSQQQAVLNYLIKIRKSRSIEKFLEYFQQQIEKEKNLIITPINTSLFREDLLHITTNTYKVEERNIYDGFMFLNKKKYMLYDHSLKSKLNKIKNLYIERIKNE